MDNNKQKLTEVFQKAKYVSDLDIANTVWKTITIRNKRNNQFKLLGFSFVGFISLAGLIPAISMLLSDLTKSGLYEYFSLIFGNNGSIASYWKDLAFSLAQSLPTMSIIFTLSLIFVFFLSLRYLMKQIERNQLLTLTTLSI